MRWRLPARIPTLLLLAAGLGASCGKVPIVPVNAGFLQADAAWFEEEEIDAMQASNAATLARSRQRSRPTTPATEERPTTATSDAPRICASLPPTARLTLA